MALYIHIVLLALLIFNVFCYNTQYRITPLEKRMTARRNCGTSDLLALPSVLYLLSKIYMYEYIF